MKASLILSTLSLFSWGLFAQKSERVTVFQSGQDTYASYRIPAIIKLPHGELLAFAEGRKGSAADFGNIDIVSKLSKDGGKTWSVIQKVVDFDSLQAGNPAPVVDYWDPEYPQGRIFLFYNTGNNHENLVRQGKGLREVWYITSTDDGKTWSVPVNITKSVHRPIQEPYKYAEDWRSYANTPGHAMQISSGRYRGRIYVAANHSIGAPKADFTDYVSHGFFTDNHGQSFQLSQSLGLPGSNEATAAELSDNRLLLNARNQKGDVRTRIAAISSDGGNTWDKTYYETSLPDPVCEGSLLSIGYRQGKSVLAFSNAADQEKRNHLTLRISFDEGLTWPISHEIDGTSDPIKHPDFTAYSDIVKLDEDRIGVLYERNDYAEIVYVSIKWE
ncbi:sialidase family protein [Aquirufa nivalisilvae]|uniref:sialidase family protein n=1 Tax=Aquirufa nivalisilvae TaxID=2516557 RepID=UPI00103287EF|nr:sialidase family protein [Aquirufa nivalisilvae]TBH72285.1 exo-alpha-sialidase [Aquirufa nivalisilvae]